MKYTYQSCTGISLLAMVLAIGSLTPAPAMAANTGCNYIDQPSPGNCTGDYKAGGEDATTGNVTITDDWGGTVYGGYSASSGAASDNRVTISGGTITDDVFGGQSKLGAADNNSVTISSGNIGGYVFGGYSNTGVADNNRVTISGGTINGAVYGGQSNGDAATNNSVTINGGNIGGYVYGGYSASSGAATNNRVTISGGTISDDVYGGYSSTGAASNNSVTINGGTINGAVLGGYSAGGAATNNSVTINGGTIGGSVYGGDSSTGAASNNSVTINGTPTFSSSTELYGGTGTSSSGNRLNLYTTGIVVREARHFQIYNLYGSSTGATTLTTTGSTAVDLSGTTINLIRITGTTKLVKDHQIILMSNVSNAAPSTSNASNVEQPGGLVRRMYDLIIEVDGGKLIAKVDSLKGEGLVDGVSSINTANIANIAALTGAQDFTAGDGIREARTVAGLDSGLNAGDGDSLRGGAFAAVTGGQLRYNAGGKTTANGMSLLGGLSIGVPLSTGQAMAGVFVESGWGSYNGRSDDITSNGNTRYFGGGLLGRYEVGGFYTEASGRIGRVENNYASTLNDGLGNSASYKTNNTYYGLHGGLGYVLPITNAVNVDMSTKYFWTHQGGNNVSILGDDVQFGAVNSQRWRNGARVNVEVAGGIVPYVGGYYEHEFDAKAKATTVGYAIAAPSLKGGTGIGELGVTFGAPADIYRVDVGVTGYAGKHSGATGSVKAKWAF